ncbi:profilin, required for normal timing of actin polymerization in response to thermal stress [Leucoagaricus gongylophorus]
MSWQEYVDSQLIQSGKVTEAAIIGLQGGIWAKSQGIQLSPEEEKAIIAGFDKPDQIQANGIRAGGVKYFTLQAGEDNIYGKKGLDGIVLARTKKAILLGTYKAPIQASETTMIVGRLNDYLRNLGY